MGSFSWWSRADGPRAVTTEAAGATQYTVPLRPGKIQGFAIFVYNPSDLTEFITGSANPISPGAPVPATIGVSDDRHHPAGGGTARGQLSHRRPHPAALLSVGPRAMAVRALLPGGCRGQPWDQRPAAARPRRLDHQERGHPAGRRDCRITQRGHRPSGQGILPEPATGRLTSSRPGTHSATAHPDPGNSRRRSPGSQTPETPTQRRRIAANSIASDAAAGGNHQVERQLQTVTHRRGGDMSRIADSALPSEWRDCRGERHRIGGSVHPHGLAARVARAVRRRC